MANEIIVTDLLGNGGDPIQYTCLDNTTILKGTLLELEDLRTVKKISANAKPIAGVAAHEKVANDGTTTIAVLTNFIGKVVCESGNATVGHDQVAKDNTNMLSDGAAADNDTGDVAGYALETATSGETYLVRFKK
jgi:hypothetical protein